MAETVNQTRNLRFMKTLKPTSKMFGKLLAGRLTTSKFALRIFARRTQVLKRWLFAKILSAQNKAKSMGC